MPAADARDMRWLELEVPPLVVWLVLALDMLGVAYAVPQPSFALPARLVLALGFAAAGGALAFAGAVVFRGQRTTVNPLDPGASTSVVSSGVHRWSRNPRYLGFLLPLIGWAVFVANLLAVLLLPVFVAFDQRGRPITAAFRSKGYTRASPRRPAGP